MKSILLTGASGMLGRAAADYFSRQENYHITATARNFSSFVNADNFFTADMTESNFIAKFPTRKFDVVIHTAALTDLEKCKQDRVLAEKIHVAATTELARQYSKSIFVYISTDSVFDGQTGNYKETDATNPPSIYAKTKLDGEKAVIANAANHYILRTNIYGFHLPPRRALFEWGFHKLKRGLAINGFTDVVFSPLYVGQLAAVISRFIEYRPPFGIYNAASDEHLSKHDFFVKCAEKFHLSVDLVKESKLPTDESLAIRPRRTFLRNDKIKYNLPDVDLTFENGLNLLEADLKTFEEHF